MVKNQLKYFLFLVLEIKWQMAETIFTFPQNEEHKVKKNASTMALLQLCLHPLSQTTFSLRNLDGFERRVPEMQKWKRTFWGECVKSIVGL